MARASGDSQLLGFWRTAAAVSGLFQNDRSLFMKSAWWHSRRISNAERSAERDSIDSSIVSRSKQLSLASDTCRFRRCGISVCRTAAAVENDPYDNVAAAERLRQALLRARREQMALATKLARGRR